MKSRSEAVRDPNSHSVAQARAQAEFMALAGACVRRFLLQNDRLALPATLLDEFLSSLWRVVQAAGLPRPLAAQEQGAPVEMSAERAASLTAQVLSGLPCPERHPDLEVPARQLLKACLNPEFRRCRDSYKEVVDGVCRRQELARTRGRISGVHCVDCPYWVALRPDQHATLLKREWVAVAAGEFAAHPGIFLPEDFRSLRVFLWRYARVA